ncbi:MAG: hypothetical protein WCO56_10985 [Verrucomicrobiota bacterium]
MKIANVHNAGRVLVVAGCLCASALFAAETAKPPSRTPLSPLAELTRQKLALDQHFKQVNAWAGHQDLQQEFREAVAQKCNLTLPAMDALKRKDTTMSYADLVVAHTLAKAANLTYDQVKAERRRYGWADNALAHSVNLSTVTTPLEEIETTMQKHADKMQANAAQMEADAQRRYDRQMQQQQQRGSRRGGRGGGGVNTGNGGGGGGGAQ